MFLGLESARITTLQNFNTEYPADTVEWCPNEGFREYFACGTYNLEKDHADTSSLPCRRKGTIILLKFNKANRQFIEVHRRQTAAILDMKWLPQVEATSSTASAVVPTLATANALGIVDVYTLEGERLELRASLECNTQVHNLLTLSLDWNWPNYNGNVMPTEPRRILASDSKGDVTLLDFIISDAQNASYKLEKVKNWEAHNFEAWICAFDKWNRDLVYTGGDDLMLHAFDLRSYQRTLTNRSHIAGVTTMLSHPKRQHLLLTGSYDERVRIFDTRSMRNPLGEINLHGGIWRIKSDPYDGDLILVACMYKNFSLVRLPLPNAGEQAPQLLAVYEEHKSICYGADWCLDVDDPKGAQKDLFMATCSFYDNKLCISSVEV